MKRVLTAALLFLASSASAQTYQPFYVGSWGVAPEFDYAPRTLYSVRGFDNNTPPRDSVRFHRLTPVQLDRARELGLNLIGATVETYDGPISNTVAQEIPRGSGTWVTQYDRGYNGDFVRRDRNPLNANAVAEICDAAINATDTLMVSISDYALANYLNGEHLMFHPESGDEFGNLGSYSTTTQGTFDDFPMAGMKLSRPLTKREGQVPNSILMESGYGDISGLDEYRKRGLSLFRATWDSTDQHNNRASGLYVLSVIVQEDPSITAIDPPNSSAVVMNVEIVSRDTTNPSGLDTLIFPLRGEQFYHGASSIRSEPFEVVLGEIEIRETDTVSGIYPYVYVRERDPGNAAWADTTAVGYDKISDTDDGFDDIDIRITFGAVNCSFLLDAVCLSSPSTFGFFYPHNPDGIAAFSARRSEAITRLNYLLYDNGAQNSIFPNLRFITGPEQGGRSGVWPTTLLGQTLLDSLAGSQAGQVNIYTATGYGEPPDMTGTMNSMVASGHYYYPVDGQYPRPTLNTTDPYDYYCQVNRPNIRGFTEMARRWRMHAEVRTQLTQQKPWIPYVQNHSNRYATDSPGWFDSDSTREPTAAELRQQCNLAIAHGANGVMFYAFVSSPWVTADANLEWPPDFATWAADTVDGAQMLDPDMGALGFVHGDLSRRECDWNGENKWDSTASYISDFLAPIGSLIHERLAWQRSKAWSVPPNADPGSSTLVSGVISFRQDLPRPIDPTDSTLVQTSEFIEVGTGTRHIFVVNGRTHPTEGHRHITVKLASDGGDDTQWKVTKILGEDEDGDIWIVRPDDTPDNTTTANGFTDYFEPGTAGLYRIEPFDEDTVGQSGICCYSNITITPGATVALSNTSLSIAASSSITVEDSLYMYNTVLSCCDAESAAHLVVRDGGGMLANQSEIENVSISIGPESHATLLGTAITPLAGTEAIYVADGSVTTYRNEIDLTSGGTFICSYGNSELRLTADSVFGNYITYASGLEISGGCCYVRGLTMKGLGFGLSALNNSYISGSEFSNPVLGENKIWTDMVCLYATGSSEIFMGEQPWGGKAGLYASHNSLGILSTGYHASNAGGSIFA
jgi:hypothetical protein